MEEFKKNKVAVLFATTASEDVLIQKMKTFSLNYEDIPFAYTTTKEIIDNLEITNKYGFVVFRDFDDGNKYLVLDELNDFQGFKQFFDSVRYPIVMEFDQAAAERIFGSQRSAMIYFSDEKDSGYETFKEFAKKHVNRIYFSHSSITKELGARLSEFIGITPQDKGTIRVIKFNEGNLDKFKVNGDSVESLE